MHIGFTRNRTRCPAQAGISDTPIWWWIHGYTTLANGNTVKKLSEKTTFIKPFINSNYEVI